MPQSFVESLVTEKGTGVFHDLLTHAMSILSTMLYNECTGAMGRLNDRKSLFPIVAEMTKFSYSRGLTSLEISVESWPQQRKLVEELADGVRAVRKAARSADRKFDLDDLLVFMTDAVTSIDDLAASITNEHVLLQHHFYKLLVQTPRNQSADSIAVAKFFIPLYVLSAQYFLHPSPETLREYVVQAEALIATPYYSDVVTGGLGSEELRELHATLNEVSEIGEELEVLALLSGK